MTLPPSPARLAAPSDADNGITDLTRELALMREENSALAARVEALTASVEALARRPDPVLDLTPQRELYARYAAALDGVAERVDAAASRFETSDLPAMRTALEQFSSASEDGAKFEAILNVVRKIADRPDPVVDLRPQRELFAKYTAVLDGLTTRFEAAASRFETDDLAALRSALEQIPTGTVPEDDGRFDKILDVFRKIADRHDPVIDLVGADPNTGQGKRASGHERLIDRAAEGRHISASLKTRRILYRQMRHGAPPWLAYMLTC